MTHYRPKPRQGLDRSALEIESRRPFGTWTGDGGELSRTAVLLDPHIRRLGFVDKMTQEGRDTFESVLSRTIYLVHPADFECFGIVLAEAAALGVPALALDQHGPQSVVRNGRTGHLFSRGTRS
jgi:glycosyltransferase involved in cell wall biosynthesis